MGKEIKNQSSDKNARDEFRHRLAQETETVVTWGKEQRFVRESPKIGLEVECCLVNDTYHAAPFNEEFLRALGNPHATTELARFNVEFNPPPLPLTGSCLSTMRRTLVDIFAHGGDVAEQMGVRLLMTGILPTLTPGDLGMRMLSPSNRYHVFAREFVRWQQGKSARVEIPDNEGLVVGINSVMMESVTTSQQIHIQIPEPGSAPYYNAAQIMAAPMVALGANSPFFLGRHLWAETRIPIFEQVMAPRFHMTPTANRRRESFFGIGYVKHSALELFTRNEELLQPLLFELSDCRNTLPHLLLHNGTIWRWNRPVISFAEDGKPVLRLEFRALPSGPTLDDTVANAAFFAASVCALANGELADMPAKTLERRLPFATVRKNFYRCAREGLKTKIDWFDGACLDVGELIQDQLIPTASAALAALRTDQRQADVALDIIRHRAAGGQNGATWQQALLGKNGGGSFGIVQMTASYYRRQIQNRPVHEWSV